VSTTKFGDLCHASFLLHTCVKFPSYPCDAPIFLELLGATVVKSFEVCVTSINQHAFLMLTPFLCSSLLLLQVSSLHRKYFARTPDLQGLSNRKSSERVRALAVSRPMSSGPGNSVGLDPCPPVCPVLAAFGSVYLICQYACLSICSIDLFVRLHICVSAFLPCACVLL
jgi:hypothetical protein